MLVEGVGMGCTLIRRDAVTKMIERFPELVDGRIALHPMGSLLTSTGTKRLIRLFEKMDIPERGIISEDLSFCIRWRECGGQVWGAIGYRMSHIGPYDYQACYLEIVTQQQAELAAQATQSQLVISAPDNKEKTADESTMTADAVVSRPPKKHRANGPQLSA